MRLNRTVSFSEIESYHKCRQAWHYRYNEGLTPIDVGESLLVGSAVHYYLAEEIRGRVFNLPLTQTSWLSANQDRYDDLFFSEMEECLVEIDEVARKVAARAADWLALGSSCGRWGPCYVNGKPAVEYEFVTKLKGTLGFKGVIDWIATDNTDDSLWIFEHKTHRTFTVEDGADLLQLPIYQHAAKQLGLDIRGTAVLQILPSLPERPKLNKNGTMSRAQIRSDWETYKTELLSAGLDPDDYKDEMIPKLEGVEWFRLSKTIRSNAEIEAIWNMIFLPAVKDICDKRKRIVRSRSSFNCARCDYRRLCEAELFGGDVDFVRKTHYLERRS